MTKETDNHSSASFLRTQAKRFKKMLLLMRLEEENSMGPDDSANKNAPREKLFNEIEALDPIPNDGDELSYRLRQAGLSSTELDIYCLRAALEEVPGFERQCAIFADRAYPDRTKRCFLEDLLCAYHGAEASRFFDGERALFTLGLLDYDRADERLPSNQRRIVLNRVLLDLLMGKKPSIAGLRVESPEKLLPTPYEDESAAALISTFEGDAANHLTGTYHFHGPPGGGKSRLARYLCARTGRNRMEISIPHLKRSMDPALEIVHLLRAAAFLKLPVMAYGMEAAKDMDFLVAHMEEELARLDLVAFMISTEKMDFTTEIKSLTCLEFRPPSMGTRARIWRDVLADHEVAEDVSIDELARMFQLTGADIRKVLREARGNVKPDGKISRGAIISLCRRRSVGRMSELAFPVEPKFGWDDLVLAPSIMHLVREIEADIKADTRIFGEWYMDKTATSAKGHNILFTGQPGTGKTMAASIIASELGLELYKIDLSRVMSKYVGDVEKNLAALFDEAEKANAALFFDEADSLFGKRGNNETAQGHYINQQIGYLLQRLESFTGIAFMATNLEKNMDKAFERRFNFIVPFIFPENVERIKIWKRAFSPETPVAEDVDFELLGREFESTGANIKSIALKASRRAAVDESRNPARVTRMDIVYATVREFDKIVKGWDLDYKGPFKSDIERVRAILRGE